MQRQDDALRILDYSMSHCNCISLIYFHHSVLSLQGLREAVQQLVIKVRLHIQEIRSCIYHSQQL